MLSGHTHVQPWLTFYVTRNSGKEKFEVQKHTFSTSFHALAPLLALPASISKTPSSLEEMKVFKAARTSFNFCLHTSSPTASRRYLSEI